MNLHDILKGAKPFDPETFEPLEGAEELLPDRPLSDAYSEVARRAAEMEAELKQMTAMWTARGEDMEYLASDLREAKYALRDISGKVQRSTQMPYRAQSSVLRQVGAMAEHALKDLEDDECDRCGKRATLRYVPEYGANFCDPCAADPLAEFKRLR